MIEIVKVNSTNAIAVLAIGDEHYQKWQKNSLPSLQIYCERNKINLYAQIESLAHISDNRKLTWQKFLIPKQIKLFYPHIKNFCYLDTDIICNPFAESIFESQISGEISLVSQFKNLPFNLKIAQRRIAFFRNKYYDKNYPLDSSLFMSPTDIFEYHGFTTFDDYACAGLFLGEIELCSNFLESVYHKYDDKFESITEGDEPVFNFEIQNNFTINWLPYKFQTLWNFEMSIKYAHLYRNQSSNKNLINDAVLSTLMDSVFLHFAGSWPEKLCWEKFSVFDQPDMIGILKEYTDYLKIPVKGSPTGMFKPNRN
jgi:hypothetical protein